MWPVGWHRSGHYHISWLGQSSPPCRPPAVGLRSTRAQPCPCRSSALQEPSPALGAQPCRMPCTASFWGSVSPATQASNTPAFPWNRTWVEGGKIGLIVMLSIAMCNNCSRFNEDFPQNIVSGHMNDINGMNHSRMCLGCSSNCPRLSALTCTCLTMPESLALAGWSGGSTSQARASAMIATTRGKLAMKVSACKKIVYFRGCKPWHYQMHISTSTYPSLGLLAYGTLENIDLYTQLGKILGQNRTKVKLKIVLK